MPEENRTVVTDDNNSKLAALYNTIIEKAEKLVNLTITTIVSDNENTERKIETIFNIIDGDIKTTIDAQFITGPYTDIRAFHSEREKLASDMLKNNIKLVKELAEWVASLCKK